MNNFGMIVISGVALLGFGRLIWNGISKPGWEEAYPKEPPVLNVRVVKDEEDETK